MDGPIIIFFTLIACAFFSGIEIAFISANKLRIELKNKQGSFSAKILSPFVKTPSKFISTTLVGNNTALVIYSIFMEEKFLHPMLEPYFHEHRYILLILATFISTIFILFTAEFLPKVLFRINPDLILEFFAVPFLIIYYIFYPLVHFITWLAKSMLNGIFRLDWKEGAPVFGKVDLDEYISQSAKMDLEEDADVDTEIFKNALDFGNVKIRQCLTPRTEIIGIEQSQSVEKLYEVLIESGHSKILVFEESIDHIVGYIHQNSLLKKPKSIRHAMMPITIATESMAARDLLNQLTKQRKSMAVVVDEFGGTAGIVTTEDILEKIFGAINDEYDNETVTEQENSQHEWVFNARLEIDHLNDKYELDLPIGEYETLGGYIFSIYQNIPESGTVIENDDFVFTILSVENTKIQDIQIKRK
ncbi:MAG: hemolysin family protein [Bacteroidota bacterium]|nr:hemolysin family protein [Bacteroidota bacterium]